MCPLEKALHAKRMSSSVGLGPGKEEMIHSSRAYPMARTEEAFASKSDSINKEFHFLLRAK